MIFSNLGFQPCMYKAFAKYALNVHAQRCNLSFAHICLEFDFPSHASKVCPNQKHGNFSYEERAEAPADSMELLCDQEKHL